LDSGLNRRRGDQAGTPALKNPHFLNREFHISKVLRGVAAGYGARKLGGGCLTTVLVFIVLWWLLGNFDIFR
jgi:hypothetical protein